MLFTPMIDSAKPIFLKKLVILRGGNKVETTWTTDHINLAKNDIGKINVQLFPLGDKKHIS
jgi:hypothetical protein